MDLDANDPLKFYLRELATIQPLAKEESALLQHVQAQDELAESSARRLIEANLSLVVPIAQRYSSADLHMLDLIEHGNEGLLLAVKTFSGGPSDSFSAHASACIEAAVLKAISESQ